MVDILSPIGSPMIGPKPRMNSENRVNPRPQLGDDNEKKRKPYRERRKGQDRRAKAKERREKTPSLSKDDPKLYDRRQPASEDRRVKDRRGYSTTKSSSLLPAWDSDKGQYIDEQI